MAPSRWLLLVAVGGVSVAAAALLLLPWLACDSGAFGPEATANCRIERLRTAPDAARFSRALDGVRPLLDNSTSSFVLGRARDALQEGESKGYDGPARELRGWIDTLFAERRVRALQMRDELEPQVLALRVPVGAGLPVERFPVRATLVLWEAGEPVATYAVEQRGGVVTLSKGEGGFPRVYALPAEFRTLYEAAKDGIGLEDWNALLGLTGKVIVER
ncbi:MAG: hypothetical protein QXO51_04130 [Halobacteria archaeon]